MFLKIKENEYYFAYDVNSLIELDDRFGIKLDNMQELQKEMGALKLFRALFWAGLIVKMPELTLKEAGVILSEYLSEEKSIEDVSDLCIKGLQKAGFFPKQ